ncbi:hypothetical protein BpHYR1_038911 [Brachionus plicatilis]|uniref:Uncharacterized protein n=1 Tax=Brachionus plicatilis TaxID=10195 RepID=A0A3M7S0H0_BRAPC|nr:hypothetical protein BpHYR1_038911 [Brachionus plicatilis]
MNFIPKSLENFKKLISKAKLANYITLLKLYVNKMLNNFLLIKFLFKFNIRNNQNILKYSFKGNIRSKRIINILSVISFRFSRLKIKIYQLHSGQHCEVLFKKFKKFKKKVLS